MDLDACSGVLAQQSGVICRRQLTAAGARGHDVKRLLRRRDLVRLYDGVFVNHTGRPTWVQRAWGGVLLAWPAALARDSALRAGDGPGRAGRDDSVIHLAVDRHRTLQVPRGYRLHRISDFEAKVQWNASPPRVRIEEALVDVAAAASGRFDAIATLSDAVRARRTTPERIRDALDARARIAHRAFLHGVLTDLGQGTCSVLEHGYLTLVERPHGLPVAERQLLDSVNGPLYRDVVYGVGQIVELDGRMWHDSPHQRDADLDRDLDAAVERLGTVRLGWGQVFARPCATAFRVGRLLNARGWPGTTRTCPACPQSLRQAS
ncbi:hypothetical protein [Nocardioides pinisoli]|uniref:Type IV toxin-antitoxin system AbiEi family antitoxin domain-containing protein n=1 Tax=Nocardioides pinisoli TaxID=2950279 RepID=A0ABT1L1S1_9ACTN|nr:hypothetical protein [Nocardioides pinisoli]MCP3423203.1 hypothetical protein [Nocardioides pinisoli]